MNTSIRQVVAIDEGNILKRAYTSDGVGNVQQISDNLERARSQRFDYDRLYRLTHTKGIYGTIDFSYEKDGYIHISAQACRIV